MIMNETISMLTGQEHAWQELLRSRVRHAMDYKHLYEFQAWA